MNGGERDREGITTTTVFTVHNETETVDDDDRNDKKNSQRMKDSGGTRRSSFVRASFRIFFTFFMFSLFVCFPLLYSQLCAYECVISSCIHFFNFFSSLFHLSRSMRTHYTFCPHSKFNEFLILFFT